MIDRGDLSAEIGSHNLFNSIVNVEKRQNLGYSNYNGNRKF